MRVFLAGGTGAIGRPSLLHLVAAGYQVTALSRNSTNDQWLRSQGAEPCTVSLYDREALVHALGGHDAVINLATAIPPTSQFMRAAAWRENTRIRCEGAKTLADAAQEAGVSRLLQESVSMIYRDAGDRWIDEQAATDQFPMAVGNHAAEASAQQFSERGGTGVVLRFGWFYGPGATHSEEFFSLAKRFGLCIQFGAPSGYLSSIHTEDAASAVVAALSVKAGIYNVVDDEPLSKRAYALALGSAAGRCWWRAPGRLARVLGHRTTSLTRSVRVSNAKLRERTRWAPSYPSAREGWQAMAERFRAR